MTDVQALCLTIWGEARGEPIEGKIGVAMVMRNRLLQHYRGANTFIEVCTAHAQFSAWADEATQLQGELAVLTADPTLGHHPDATLRLCLEIARATMAGLLADNTRGSNHYYAVTIAPPNWTSGAFANARLGNHLFYAVA